MNLTRQQWTLWKESKPLLIVSVASPEPAHDGLCYHGSSIHVPHPLPHVNQGNKTPLKTGIFKLHKTPNFPLYVFLQMNLFNPKTLLCHHNFRDLLPVPYPGG